MSVIQELSDAVTRKTSGRVVVVAGRIEKRTLLPGLQDVMQRTIESISGELPEPEIPDALFAMRTGGGYGKRAQLCRLKLETLGYPVELSLAGAFLFANNSEALTAAFVQLLKHPDVDGKIERVSRLDIASDATPKLAPGSSDE